MSVSGTSRSIPPTLAVSISGQPFQMKLLAPKLIPMGEVAGFEMDDDFLSQERVDHAIEALVAFIEGAPTDDQVVYAALLAQARDASDASWPG